MLKIFICEDNNLQRESVERVVNNTIIIENLDMEITLSTHNPYDVLNHLKNYKGRGLYFLDVDLNSDINGIQLAEKIREYDPRGFIVFITTHAEICYLTFQYKVEAMDYIIKSRSAKIDDRIKECILNANKKYSSDVGDFKKNFTFKVGDKVISMEYDDIIYFETSQTIHKVIIHSINRQIEFYGKIKEIESKLDNRFYRCHKSYLINKNNITEVDTKERKVLMINKEQCLVSSRKMKDLI